MPLENQTFAKLALTKIQADSATKLLYLDKQAFMKNNYEAQWNNRLLLFQDYQMPFHYQIYGEEPTGGKSLFISLHGGGGAPLTVNKT